MISKIEIEKRKPEDNWFAPDDADWALRITRGQVTDIQYLTDGNRERLIDVLCGTEDLFGELTYLSTTYSMSQDELQGRLATLVEIMKAGMQS